MLLCQFLVLAGNWQFFCCGGKNLLRPEQKVPVVCLAGCAVVSVFGSGDYNWEKKSSSCLSGGLCCRVSFWFWCLGPEKKSYVVCLAGCAVVSVFGSGDYDRKKKVPVSIKFVLIQLELKLIQIR